MIELFKLLINPHKLLSGVSDNPKTRKQIYILLLLLIPLGVTGIVFGALGNSVGTTFVGSLLLMITTAITYLATKKQKEEDKKDEPKPENR